MRMIRDDKRYQNTWDIRIQCWGFKSTLIIEKEEAGITQTALQSAVSWRTWKGNEILFICIRLNLCLNRCSFCPPHVPGYSTLPPCSTFIHTLPATHCACMYAYLSITAGPDGIRVSHDLAEDVTFHVFVHLIWGLFSWSARREDRRGRRCLSSVKIEIWPFL